jgi:BirA family biotin operon repressor/biotin-[acetyl-CoA-carboxylase] ligase
LPHPPGHKPLGLPFIELQSIDSTNNYAREQIYAALAQHGTTIFTHEQLAGKGQRGKSWSSEKSANIMMSVVIKPGPIKLADQFWLNACVAVVIHEFLSSYTGDDTKIKWPNDIYWQDRKAGGVLIESGVGSRELGVGKQESGVGNRELGNGHTSTNAQWNWAIVGIGINVNQTVFPSHIPNAVSMKQITGKNFDTIKLAKELCSVLDKKFNGLLNDGFENIYSSYLDHLYKKDKTVKLKKGNRVFEATIKTVSPSGKLVVHPDGHRDIEEEFDFGEIKWVM